MVRHAGYRCNRQPLAPNAYASLPPGSIRARGWLHEQLRLSADGLTGHMMDIWPDVGRDSGWLGGKGENWERGPYYARGLIALAYTLGDERLIEQARPWVEWSLASQRTDGFFGPGDNGDWWPRMPMLEGLRLHHEATGDERVPPFVSRYLRHQLAALPVRPLEGWSRPRGGDNIDAALWLYSHTGESFLLALADLLHEQTCDWTAELAGGGPPSDAFELAHGVNRAMGLKEPAVYFQRSRDPRHLAAVRAGWEQTLRHHGQIQGTFSCDEMLHGPGSTQGTELCTIVELLSTFETVLKISGELWLADAIERIAYNALPAMLAPDLRSHQYFQLPNQIECSPGPHKFWIHHDTDLLFGVATGYGCCAANLHLAWPQLVNHLWLATPDHGLFAPLFAPSVVHARVGGGAEVVIEEATAYPFDEEVCFIIGTGAPVAFPLSLRIPAWAARARLELNGGRVAETAMTSTAEPGESRRITITRRWANGDRLTVTLPMPVRLSSWERRSVGVERGPLVYALPVGEDWRPVGGTPPFRDFEVYPTTPWNYGLVLDRADPEGAFGVQRGPVAAQPWDRDGAGVRVTITGKRLPHWTAEDGVSAPIPETGLAPDTAAELLTLVPFGAARLRISMFPVVS